MHLEHLAQGLPHSKISINWLTLLLVALELGGEENGEVNLLLKNSRAK